MEAKEGQVEVEELQRRIAQLQSENQRYKSQYKEVKQTLKDNVVVLREVQNRSKGCKGAQLESFATGGRRITS